MIAVFAAMTSEVAGFGRRLAKRKGAQVGGYPIRWGEYAGKPVLLCRTGLGRRAEAAVRAVLDRYPASGGVLSAGVGGALNPEFRVGDLVVCESVRRTPSRDLDPALVHSDQRLVRLAYARAEEADLRVWLGQSLTVDRVVGDPAEKEALRRSWGLDVVEMESYWVGLVAQERGLPFLAVRVISDVAGDAVPDIPGVMTPEGEVRLGKVIPHVLRHPASIPHLLRLALSSRRAAGELTRFLEAFVGAFEVSPVAEPA